MWNSRSGFALFLIYGLAAAASAQGPGDRGWYGVVQNDAEGPEWAQRAADLGVGWVKVRLKDTDLLEPGQPMYDFIAASREAGLEVVVLFNHESVGTDYVWPDLDQTLARAREVADRIGPMVSAWEVWNEPLSIEPERDMGPDTLAELLGTVYPAFSGTGKPVLAAGEWTTGSADDFRDQMADWWETNRPFFPDVEGDWPFDAMAVHAYFLEGWDAEALVDASMSRIASRFGEGMPVWVTEFGYPADEETGYEGQQEAIESVSSAFAKWGNADRMFYYSLKDYPGDESGAHMGLYDMEGNPKPGASAWGLPGSTDAEQGNPGQDPDPEANPEPESNPEHEYEYEPGQTTPLPSDFQERRNALRRAFARAKSPAEKQAILAQYRALGAPAAHPAGGGVPYVVQKGDTLWDIARAHGVPLADLVAANPEISNPDLIHPGQTIAIPAAR